MYDVIIVGGGVAGAASARELSRYKVKACVLEKEEDVCCGTSKANSAIVHAGYDAATGSLMAKLNVRGNAMMEQLSKDLDFPFKRTGSFVICLSEEDMPGLQTLYDRGVANGVKDLQILNREEVLKMEPNIVDNVYAALYAPTAGIVCPFHLNIALAENAFENGVEFKFNTEVQNIRQTENGWRIETNQGAYETKYVVNAAGVYADKLHNMVSEKKIHITPRRGDYCLLDKTAGNHVSRTIFALPTKYGKGVLVTPTIHGNLLIGPTAIDVDDREGTNTTAEGLEQVIGKAGQNVKNLPLRQVITSFAGLRAHEDGHEFLIGELEDAKGFIDPKYAKGRLSVSFRLLISPSVPSENSVCGKNSVPDAAFVLFIVRHLHVGTACSHYKNSFFYIFHILFFPVCGVVQQRSWANLDLLLFLAGG